MAAVVAVAVAAPVVAGMRIVPAANAVMDVVVVVTVLVVVGAVAVADGRSAIASRGAVAVEVGLVRARLRHLKGAAERTR